MKRVLIVLDDDVFESLNRKKEEQGKTWEEFLIDPWIVKLSERKH